MGVRGKRPLKALDNNYKEPDLIVDVKSIINNATQNDFLDGKGNIKLEKVAEYENIEVRYEDLPSAESGYFKAQDGKCVIGINKKHNVRRQRFTFAHELGHFYLHRGSQSNVVYEDEVFFRIENSSSIEFAANEFAARLLIPEERLTEMINKGMTDLKELADFFDVSMPAMKYRVLSLNYSIVDNG